MIVEDIHVEKFHADPETTGASLTFIVLIFTSAIIHTTDEARREHKAPLAPVWCEQALPSGLLCTSQLHTNKYINLSDSSGAILLLGRRRSR